MRTGDAATGAARLSSRAVHREQLLRALWPHGQWATMAPTKTLHRASANSTAPKNRHDRRIRTGLGAPTAPITQESAPRSRQSPRDSLSSARLTNSGDHLTHRSACFAHSVACMDHRCVGACPPSARMTGANDWMGRSRPAAICASAPTAHRTPETADRTTRRAPCRVARVQAGTPARPRGTADPCASKHHTDLLYSRAT